MSLLYPAAKTPDSEIARLHALRQLECLWNQPNPPFDALCRTARSLFSVPIALIALVGDDDRGSAAHCGTAAIGSVRHAGFWAHASLTDGVLVIEDATCDPRFKDDPLVDGDASIRFFAGAPIILEHGPRVGTLCIIDTEPRILSAEQATQLADLASIAVACLRLRDADPSEQAQSARLEARPTDSIKPEHFGEANELLSLVEQLAQIGHWRIGAETGILETSAGFERIFGREPAAASLNVIDHLGLIHPEDRERIREKIRQIAAGEIDGYENRSRLFRPDGEMRVIIARAFAQRAQDGRVTAVFGACVDITEATKAEHLLREKTALLTKTLDNMDEGLFVVDAEHRLVLGNRRGAELFNLPADWLATRPILAEQLELHGGDRLPDRPMPEELWCNATGVRDIREFTRPNGMIVELRSVRLEDGSSVWTCADVTARRQAEKAMQESETLYRFLTETVTDIIYRRDVRGHVGYVSPASLDVLGYEPDEMRQRPFEDLAHPDDFEALVGSVADLRAGRVNQTCLTYRLRHKNNGWIWIESRARLIRDAAGTPVEVISTLRDVTDRVVVEQRLRDSEERLGLALSSESDGLWDWNLVTDQVVFSDGLMPKLPVVLRGTARFADVLDTLVDLSERDTLLIALREHCEGRSAAFEAECRVQTFMNEELWMRTRGRVVERGPDGTPVRMVGTIVDITSQKGAEERIAHMVRHDPLTDLPNRAHFVERLKARLAEAKRHGGTLAVLCLNLDRFKTLNDTLGHSAGDSILREIADRLSRAMRDEDTVARIGGDEFAVLAPDFSANKTRRLDALAAHLIEVVNQPVIHDGLSIEVGLTIGIAIAPGDGDDADELFKRADLALVRGKNETRNTFRFFEAGTDEAMAKRRQLEIDIRNAIAREEFELHYQPVMDIRRGRISGFEALLRWQHPDRGMVSPAEVIPIAEETGLIVPIGEWVLRTACREAMEWADKSLKIAVNVSARQFRQQGLVASIVTALAKSGLPADRLELEITESLLIGSGDAVLATVQQIRAMGIRVALDDFGTGYSSLSYLHRFPFDRVKIDQSFMRDIGNPKTAAIVRATVDLARRLGMAVTAEGVETAEQLTLAHAEGCMEIQGYLISRPVCASDARALAQGTKTPGERRFKPLVSAPPQPASVVAV